MPREGQGGRRKVAASVVASSRTLPRRRGAVCSIKWPAGGSAKATGTDMNVRLKWQRAGQVPNFWIWLCIYIFWKNSIYCQSPKLVNVTNTRTPWNSWLRIVNACVIKTLRPGIKKHGHGRMRIWLVVFRPTPLKNDGQLVSWDDFPFPLPNWMESHNPFHGSSHHQPGILVSASLILLDLHQDDGWGFPSNKKLVVIIQFSFAIRALQQLLRNTQIITQLLLLVILLVISFSLPPKLSQPFCSLISPVLLCWLWCFCWKVLACVFFPRLCLWFCVSRAIPSLGS